MADKLDAILRLEVPIIVQIGRRQMPLEGILALAPGAIIELPKSADEELDLLVNNKSIGAGVAVKVGENFGIRISRIGDMRTRIAALGVSPAELGVGPVETPAPNPAEAPGQKPTPKPAPAAGASSVAA